MTDPSILLKRARDLDEQALGEIYDTYSQAIYRYAMRLLGDVAQAEECVAETFSRLLIALSNGGGPNDNLKAYLFRMAHNWITDCYRRRLPEEPLDFEIAADHSFDPLHQVDQAHTRQQVRSALRLITPEQRQVIVLKFLEEFDNLEIARIIGKPVGSVKSLQHRGLAALRRVLVKEQKVDE